MQMIRSLIVALVAVSLAATAFASGEEESAGAGAIELRPVNFYDDFPDSFPAIPRPVDPESYAYDDLSESHDFEMMTYGYTVAPMPDNPITDNISTSSSTPTSRSPTFPAASFPTRSRCASHREIRPISSTWPVPAARTPR